MGVNQRPPHQEDKMQSLVLAAVLTLKRPSWSKVPLTSPYPSSTASPWLLDTTPYQPRQTLTKIIFRLLNTESSNRRLKLLGTSAVYENNESTIFLSRPRLSLDLDITDTTLSTCRTQ